MESSYAITDKGFAALRTIGDFDTAEPCPLLNTCQGSKPVGADGLARTRAPRGGRRGWGAAWPALRSRNRERRKAVRRQDRVHVFGLVDRHAAVAEPPRVGGGDTFNGYCAILAGAV
ncbi:hypothetical protein ABH935_008655 [Catenulispora sp. GAS73]